MLIYIEIHISHISMRKKIVNIRHEYMRDEPVSRVLFIFQGKQCENTHTALQYT